MTSVPTVTFGDNGFVAPEASAVLEGVIADYQDAFSGKLNLDIAVPSSLATPQGQLASSQAADIEQANEDFLFQSQMTDPAYATGRWQDGIARIYVIYRIGAEPTVLQINCVGLEGVPIPTGSKIQDVSGNVYVSTQDAVIPVAGTIAVPFANLVPGPIAIPGTDEVSIFTAIPGWDSVTVASGVLGNDTESRAAFEERRAATVAGNSFGAAGSIIGAVSKVSGVLDFFPYDNGSASPATVKGVSIAANSIYVCVSGGTDADVAQAILSKKAPGCAYTGNTTVTAYDRNPLYADPVAYQVKFQRPSGLQFLFAIDIVDGPTIPSNADVLIQNAIIAAFAGADGGSRARIGTTVLASRFYAPVASLGAWALRNILSIKIGSNNTPAASFTAAIAGTALTIGSLASGTIAIGQTLFDAAGGIVAGTKIISGSGSSWVVDTSQTVGSRAMTSAIADRDSVDVNADQAPEVIADNIVVALT